MQSLIAWAIINCAPKQGQHNRSLKAVNMKLEPENVQALHSNMPEDMKGKPFCELSWYLFCWIHMRLRDADNVITPEQISEAIGAHAVYAKEHQLIDLGYRPISRFPSFNVRPAPTQYARLLEIVGSSILTMMPVYRPGAISSQEYLSDLVVALEEAFSIDKRLWDHLRQEDQHWFNAASEACNTNKLVPFPAGFVIVKSADATLEKA